MKSWKPSKFRFWVCTYSKKPRFLIFLFHLYKFWKSIFFPPCSDKNTNPAEVCPIRHLLSASTTYLSWNLSLGWKVNQLVYRPSARIDLDRQYVNATQRVYHETLIWQQSYHLLLSMRQIFPPLFPPLNCCHRASYKKETRRGNSATECWPCSSYYRVN